MKEFSELKRLHQTLKEKDEVKRKEEEARRRKEKNLQREAELFRDSIGDVIPLKPDDRITPSAIKPAPVPLQRIADEKAAFQESISDELNIDSLLETDADLSFARNGISRDVLRKLRRGHWVIQGQLDLHGARREKARDLLNDFLRRSELRGTRCVRIIHGKGLGSVNQEPVLKKLVRSWLMQKKEVIAFCQAKASDGGSGAVVVLLKGRTHG